MRKKGRNTFLHVVKNPAAGLMTTYPEDMADARGQRAAISCSNMRYRRGAMRNAPGYIRMGTTPELDSPPHLLFQANIISDLVQVESRTPVIFTNGKVYALSRGLNEAPIVDAG